MASAMPDLRTFPATGHHRPLTGTNCLTEAYVCEQLDQGCCLKVRAGNRIRYLQSRKSNALIPLPPGQQG